MRKITQQAKTAFFNFYNFSQSNTTVKVEENDVFLYLHNNKIASYNNDTWRLRLYNRGWETTTTKERLNGLLESYNLWITQKKGVWYVSNGQNLTEFEEGQSVSYYLQKLSEPIL